MAMPTEPTIPLSELELFCNGLDHSEGIMRHAPPARSTSAARPGRSTGSRTTARRPRCTRPTGSCSAWPATPTAPIYAVDVDCPLRLARRLEAGTQERFFEGLPDRPARPPNWGAFDAHGNYYLSDSGDWGARDGLIWVRRAGGEVEVFTEESRNFPNGMAVSADSRTLWVAESYPSALVRYAIGEDGAAGPREHLSTSARRCPTVSRCARTARCCSPATGPTRCSDGRRLLSRDVRDRPARDRAGRADEHRLHGPGPQRAGGAQPRPLASDADPSGLVGVPLHYPTRAQIDAVAGPAA